MSAADEWLGKLAQLKVDKASGDAAPHKPLLLLVVLELAEQGLLPPHELELTPRAGLSLRHLLEHRRQAP
jgi:hypothetical protein